ncbi:probable ATP-dependent DNA helicase HFM1 isoform X2 [Cloeon dipterum]|uniref:probable ATP-dependent DNA helicase HFM1 isoform X2 n=1 Tax=Cloeon dipterum TaxID=197152 RepID=UPI00321FE65F
MENFREFLSSLGIFVEDELETDYSEDYDHPDPPKNYLSSFDFQEEALRQLQSSPLNEPDDFEDDSGGDEGLLFNGTGLALFQSQPQQHQEVEQNFSQGSAGSFFDVQPDELLGVENERVNNASLQSVPNSMYPVDNLCRISIIAPKYRSIFKNIPFFNVIQSKVLDPVLNSDRPVVVAAPTGSGKTVIFELAIVWLLMQIERESPGWTDFKIIYIAPVKALCSERLADWNEKFGSVGLSCSEVTGDMENTYNSALRKHQIILTTPEKWDSMTRRWKDNRGLVQHVRLILIDEVHLLNEERRGPILEAVVSRMKTVQLSLELEGHVQGVGPKGIRFLAVSATIPNIEDIAQWLGCRSPQLPLHFSVSEDERPVKLKKIVYGYDSRPGWSSFRFDMQLNYRLKEILLKHSDGKPSLIFCSTRKSVTQCSDILIKELVFMPSPKQKEDIKSMVGKLMDKKIGEALNRGVGAHHAGMHKNDRQIVENLFKNGSLPVLVSTSTLAMGVNLPAHLVVIKSTEQYIGGTYAEYGENAVLQMMGRAGRPQYDTSATAVIMTKMSQKAKYERLVGGKQAIESTLHRHLAEHLNAEVVLQTITNLNLAMTWLRSTYLYVRACKNPRAYNLPNDNRVETHLNNLCMKEMTALAKCGVVIMDGCNITSTDAGKIMAKYCLSLQSMNKFFENVKNAMTMDNLLHVVSKCSEFEEYQLRVIEKRTLNELNKKIRYKVAGKVQSIHSKVFVLIQANLDGLQCQDVALQQESFKIMKVAQRVSKCLDEFIRSKFPADFSSVLNALLLSKSIGKSMWHDSNLVAKQLNGIGPKYAENLVAAGKSSFRSIKESNPRDLERIMGIGTAKGNGFVSQATCLPDYELKLDSSKDGLETVDLRVSCVLGNAADLRQGKTAGARHTSLFILADKTNNQVIYSEKISDLYLMRNTYTFSTSYVLPAAEDCITEIVASICSETWVGIDKTELIKVDCPRKISEQMETRVEDAPTLAVKSKSQPKKAKAPAAKTKGDAAAKKKPSICTQTLEKYKMLLKKPSRIIRPQIQIQPPCVASCEPEIRPEIEPMQLTAPLDVEMTPAPECVENSPPASLHSGSSSPSYSPLYSPSISAASSPQVKKTYILDYPLPKLNFHLEFESDDDEFESGPFKGECLPKLSDKRPTHTVVNKFKRTLSPARDADTFMDTVFEALGSAVTPIISTYLKSSAFDVTENSIHKNCTGN